MAIHDLQYAIHVQDAELKQLRTEAQRVAKQLGLIGPETARGAGQAGSAIADLERRAQQSATRRIASEAQVRRGLEQQLLVYRQVAKTATVGSAEQVAAARLAERAVARLDGTTRRTATDTKLLAAGYRSARSSILGITAATVGLSSAAAGIGAAIKQGFDFNALKETSEIAFGALTGDVEKGKQLVKELITLAQQAPNFDIPGALEGAKRLLAMGFTAEQIIPTMHGLSDAVAAVGGNADTLDRVVLAIGQIRAKGLLQSQEMRQLNEAGIRSWDFLAKELDTTVADAMKRVQNRQVDAATALRAIFKGVEEQAGGLSEAQRHSFAGLRANLADTIRIVEGRALAHAFDEAEDAMARLQERLNDPAVQRQIELFVDDLENDLVPAAKGVADVVEESWPIVEQTLKVSADAAHLLAGSLELVKKTLDEISKITPGDGGDLLRLIILGGLGLKFGGKLGGKLAATGVGAAATSGQSDVVRRILESTGQTVTAGAGARAATGGFDVKGLGKFLARFGKIAAPAGAAGALFGASPDERTLDQLPESSRRYFLDRLKKDTAGAVSDGLSAGAQKGARQAAIDWNKVFPTDVIATASAAAQKAAKTVGDAFQPFTDKAEQAFDAVTDGQLDAFDRQTSALEDALSEKFSRQLDAFDEQTGKLEERLRVAVKVKGLHETFRIGVEGKTPAERELAALDKLDARRKSARDLEDANRQLASARQLGDPEAIKDALRAVEDARSGSRRQQLETRAEVERKAADAALKTGKEQLDKRRQTERDGIEQQQKLSKQALDDSRAALRRDLEQRRAYLREHLEMELAALNKEIQTGKLTAQEGQQKILATLSRYGVDYASMGKTLGSRFIKGFDESLSKVDRLQARLHKAVEDLAVLKEHKKFLEQIAKAGVSLDVDARHAALLGIKRAGGGIVPGSGSGDTVPAMLTPGELVLNERQQRILAAKLGLPVGDARKLFAAAQRFASGGIAGSTGETALLPPDGRLERLLERLIAAIARNQVAADTAAARGGGLDPNGYLFSRSPEAAARVAAALRKLEPPGPVSIPSLVQHSPAARLGREAKLRLEQQLAQAQAHPERAGLIVSHAEGTATLGRGLRAIRPRAEQIPAGAFGRDVVLQVTVVDESGREKFRQTRRASTKHALRTTIKKTGRNAGRRVMD